MSSVQPGLFLVNLIKVFDQKSTFVCNQRSYIMNPLNPSEQRNLWDSLRHDNPNALSQLYDLFAADLYRYGCTLIHNKNVIEDYLHDYFLYLHRNRQRLHPTDNIRLYLFQGFRQRLLDAEAQPNMNNRATCKVNNAA